MKKTPNKPEAQNPTAADENSVSNLISRRRMLGITSIAGLATLSGVSSDLFAQTPQGGKPKIACIVSFWGATRSHADWIICKLMDGYWWEGAHKESRVEVASVFLDQFDSSLLGQKVCKAKNVPIYKTVAEALTLGGNELAVDGVVIIGEHGNYPTSMKGQWLLPRWAMFNQVVRVFERSKRTVPVFNDKHYAGTWGESKWIFDKSRELNFPLSGGSSIPTQYRSPSIELENETPIKNSIVVADSPDEGALFHCIDLLQSFVERRKGGETGVKAIQWIKGPETWAWTEKNPWAGKLLEAVRVKAGKKEGHYQEFQRPNVYVIEYNDGTKAAIYSTASSAWYYAGDIAGKPEPVVVMAASNGFPGPFAQYHASNDFAHWITEMMVTKKEPFNAERLLLSSGLTNFALESNWEYEKYSAVGKRIETPMLNMSYKPTRGAQFNTGAEPPNRPYIRGFSQ